MFHVKHPLSCILFLASITKRLPADTYWKMLFQKQFSYKMMRFTDIFSVSKTDKINQNNMSCSWRTIFCFISVPSCRLFQVFYFSKTIISARLLFGHIHKPQKATFYKFLILCCLQALFSRKASKHRVPAQTFPLPA